MMNPFLKHIVRKKLTEVTPNELIIQARNYNVELTQVQAVQIVKILSRKDLDPFKKTDLASLLKQLEQITDQTTVKKAKIILNQFIKQYNVADWFY